MPTAQTAGFYNTDLTGAVTSAIPTISYAFNQNNYDFFGIDATYTGYFNEQFRVTPTLQFPNGGSAYCTPFTANVPSQSIDCNYQDNEAQPGLYTLDFNMCTTVFSDDPCTSTTLPGAVTFSVVASPTTTVMPTNTITVTATSGATDTTATTTTVPSTIVTVTTYFINAITTATTTLTGAKTITVTGTCSSKASACNHDNCLRALLGKTSSASAFCAAYTAGPSYHGTTPSAFATSCMSSASRLSSACTCLPTSAVKPRMLMRGVRTGYEESVPEVEERGVVPNLYAPPDYTYGPGQYTSGTFFAANTATVTDTAAIVPSTTTTDPGALVTSGKTTSTLQDPSTQTVQTATIDSRTTVTATLPPSNC